MGVSGLWNLISPIKRDVKLSECQGKKLAVDLSSWIVQCSSTPTQSGMAYQCSRSLFFRTLSVLSLGISLVFVLDSPEPPKMKKKTKSRMEFYKLSLQYKELMEALGIPVLTSKGEAEKLCAQLNRNNFVDGVLTEDGDVFVYGACTVYKGFSTDHRNKVATEYRMEDITETLGLTHRDLIAFALINKGDLCDGIHNVGEKSFTALHNEMKVNQVEDVLSRILDWKNNICLKELEEIQHNLKAVKKARHCSKCCHEGTKQQHDASGCCTCKKDMSCIDVSDNMHCPCPCQYHQMESRVKPFSTEIKIRSLALQKPDSFPNLEVVNEYMAEDQMAESYCTSLNMPNFRKLSEILQAKVKLDPVDCFRHLVPTCIRMSIYGTLPQFQVNPLRIEKSCIDKGEQCYKVRWSKKEIDGISNGLIPDEPLTIPAVDFAKFYPVMAKNFESTKKCPKGNRKRGIDPSQRKMTDMFKVMKSASTIRPTSPKPHLNVDTGS